MQKYYLYILYSESINRYYIGVSHDPEMRLYYHNSDAKGWTYRGRPWKFVYTREFRNKTEALKWERKLKRIKRRSVIESIIQDEFEWT
jgi:putative endonuclease